MKFCTLAAPTAALLTASSLFALPAPVACWKADGDAQATTAGLGNLQPMRETLQQVLGRQVGASPFYRLLARRGWQKAGSGKLWRLGGN